jgi:hypothetical protein
VSELCKIHQPGEPRPEYPEGDVLAWCVCGSWPGGKCLKCEWIEPEAERVPD